MRAEIIAEIGQNHNGDIDCAMELIRCAKDGGADVAKFQLYDAHQLFEEGPANPWFEYNCKTELSQKDVSLLANYCRTLNIEFMASVFDVERVKWLEEVGVKRYKIASRSIFDSDLIEAVSATRKPILASLGHWKGNAFPMFSTDVKVDFLYCISKYPTPLNELKLSAVDFKRYIGFSDHSLGITAACSAIVRGATVIEKHLTLDKHAYGPDHSGSMDAGELKALDRFRNEWTECK